MIYNLNIALYFCAILSCGGLGFYCFSRHHEVPESTIFSVLYPLLFGVFFSGMVYIFQSWSGLNLWTLAPMIVGMIISVYYANNIIDPK